MKGMGLKAGEYSPAFYMLELPVVHGIGLFVLAGAICGDDPRIKLDHLQ